MLSLADNPPVLYAAHEGEPADVLWHQCWRAAYVRPRQEKALARELLERQVTYFLPMVVRETSSGGRRRRNLHALFPSYLFFAGDDDARLACLRTNRTVQLIEPEGEEHDRLRDELQALATVLQTNPAKLELHNALVPGSHVRVKSGPMRDVEGTVIETGSTTRLQLAVTLLGVGVVVEIHPDLVELL